jgi:hypothetical protein
LGFTGLGFTGGGFTDGAGPELVTAGVPDVTEPVADGLVIAGTSPSVPAQADRPNVTRAPSVRKRRRGARSLPQDVTNMLVMY